MTKIADNTAYYNLFGDSPLNKSGVSCFYVKVVSAAQKNVIIGVGSKFVRGIQNGYTHPDFIGFYLYGEGYIW